MGGLTPLSATPFKPTAAPAGAKLAPAAAPVATNNYPAPNNAAGSNQLPIQPAAAPAPTPTALQAAQLQALQQQQQLAQDQKAAAGLQYGVQTGAAQGSYNTGIQGLNLQGQNIQDQLRNLGNDQAYYKGVQGNTIKDYNADIRYNQTRNQLANSLFNTLGQNYTAQGQMYNTQLGEQLAGLQAQRGQAQNTYGANLQQLNEAIGSQGAFGSKGAGERTSSLGQTLQNALAGFNAQGQQYSTQNQLSQSQLQNQLGQALNARNSDLALDQRRTVNDQGGISRANLDYIHQLSGINLNKQQLGIAAKQIGVSKQQLANQLQSQLGQASVNRLGQTIQSQSSGIDYGSQIAQILGQIAQNQVAAPAAYNNNVPSNTAPTNTPNINSYNNPGNLGLTQ